MLNMQIRNGIGFILLLSFVVAPLYSRFNVGGLGLDLPYNSAAWLLSLLFICSALIWSLKSHTIIVSHVYTYSLIFPFALIFSGFSSDVPQQIDWLFRQLYIVGGFAFLFALFQMRFMEKQVNWVLYSFVISTLLQIIISICQIYKFPLFENIIPYSENKIPFGIFQQVNVLATYLVTGLMIILYLMSRPLFNASRIPTKALFVTTFSLGVYVIILTGSRVGVLSLIVSSVLMIISRKSQLKPHKKMLFLLVLTSTVAIFSGQGGFVHALNKTETMTEGQYSSVRQTMYAVGMDLVENKPFFGYGIGSFRRVWTDQTAIFAKQHPDAEISQGSVSHPHNEVLLWMIEGGLVATFGILIITILVSCVLYRLGFSRGGAYFALLFPITFHTQVELPFYVSSVHWFLWLFLIYLVLRHDLTIISFSMSRAMRVFSQCTVFFAGIVGGTIIWHASMAQFELAKYTHGKGGDLTVAINDLYFNDAAEKLLMQTLLHSSMEEDNKEQIPQFISWAEKRIQYSPERGMFIMLSDAYGFIHDINNQCRVANKGIAIYTKNIRLQETVDQCRSMGAD